MCSIYYVLQWIYKYINMYFDPSNAIILLSILLFLTYLTLPTPIILIEKKYDNKNEHNNCFNC